MLSVIGNIILIVASFLFMEFVAWFTHKHIMHGFLWSWHKSHHTLHDHTLERNDLFALVFSIPAIGAILLGSLFPNLGFLLYVGIGITCYGIFYLLFHDIIVHQRIKFKFKHKGRYLRRMINSHFTHHKKHTKEGCEAFGFLYAPKKYER